MDHYSLPNVFVPREKLMKLFDDRTNYRIIYIYAPPGYGKTVSANMWLAQSGLQYTSITLDQYDNNPAVFCRRFCTALLDMQSADHDAVRKILDDSVFESAPVEYTIRLLYSIQPTKTRKYILLDDLHKIHNAQVLKMLPILVNRLPDEYSFLMLSRNALPDSLFNMLAGSGVSAVDAKHLLFSRADIMTLYQSAGRDISEQQAEMIHHVTDGWAIAVNALLLSGREPSDETIIKNHLEAFIKNEIWENWDAETQFFLLDTSVAEDMDLSICEALTQTKNCAAILGSLISESAFLRKTGSDSYRFHDIFRSFLLNLLQSAGDGRYEAQISKAGDWYFSQNDYYRAIAYYKAAVDLGGLEKCLEAISAYDSPYFIIDNVLDAMRLPVADKIAGKHPFFLPTLAWASFLEARPEDMAKYADLLYKNTKKPLKMPLLLQHSVFISCLDYRIPMLDLLATMQKLPFRPKADIRSGTISQNMPLLHRSSRDFSEFTPDTDRKVTLLKQIIGSMFGEECDLLEDCLRGGLLYEQGNINEAHRLALSANARIKDGFSNELKFCAMVLLAQTQDAQNMDIAQSILPEIESMIEQNNAYYLSYNFNAIKTRQALKNGDAQIAQKWIDEYGTGLYEHMPFYKIYGHFASVRAYITLGEYDAAIILLQKLTALGKTYKRPIDLMEAGILSAIAYWHKSPGFQPEAMAHLEHALCLAYPYGYTQVFAYEGAALTSMLSRLQKRALRQDYDGDIPASYIKKIYLLAHHQAKLAKGLTGGRAYEDATFTQRQLQVMKLLCEGNSYRQIADMLGVKFSTIRSHIELIYKKLNVSNETEAILKIKDLGLLES